MTAAEKSAKEDGTVRAAKGVIQVPGPGESNVVIYTRPPRPPGPHYRVKHPQFGHRLVAARDEDEALQKFFAEFSPANATDLAWCKEHMRLNGGRLARLSGSEPEAPKPPATPERAKK